MSMLFSGRVIPDRALLFANGDLNDGPAVQAALRHAPSAQIIGVDGGTRLAQACGLLPDVVIGDMDSLSEAELTTLGGQGVTIQRFPPAKKETDLELALLETAARGATWIRVIGAVGDRLDQTLANVSLLALPPLAGRDVRLVFGAQTLWLIGPGAHPLDGQPGDTISLLPLTSEVSGIRTKRLVYPLTGETLRLGAARGVSNVIETAGAAVTVNEGLLIVVHTPGRA